MSEPLNLKVGFIHTADWQVGMTFHGFIEKARIMMEDDRLEVIEAIGAYANKEQNGVDFVLVCGDMFETPHGRSRTDSRVEWQVLKIQKTRISQNPNLGSRKENDVGKVGAQ